MSESIRCNLLTETAQDDMATHHDLALHHLLILTTRTILHRQLGTVTYL